MEGPAESHKAKISTSAGVFEFEGSREYVEAQVEMIMSNMTLSETTGPKPSDAGGPLPKAPKTPKLARQKVAEPKPLSSLISDTASLRTFYELKDPKNHPENYVVIASWLKSNTECKNYSIDEMYTAYKLLRIKPPKVMVQVFRDAKAKGLWFDQAKEQPGRFELTIHGEAFVEHDLPRQKPKPKKDVA
jgi:hypothetical protein